MKNITDYRMIVGDAVIGEIYQKAKRLYGKRVLNINSTFIGGGVAEILSSLAPLINNVGIDADWRVLHGTPDFFNITKKFHNALQGEAIDLSEFERKLYVQANEDFSAYAKIDHDLVIVHDPQPLPLIEFYKKRQPWIWRCHIDLSNPDEMLWEFLKGFIIRYDTVIVSHEKYKKKDLSVRQRIIQPVINPLTPKNMELSETQVANILKEHSVPTDKPIMTQISRFDKWKDPLGVVDVFQRVRRHIDCRLVLCGSMAMDDPEGMQIFEQVKERVGDLIETGDVILITYENSLLVNAIQRASTVILQKSIREGFGLTVTEAMWKSTPIVASKVGGIPLQITDGVDGYLVEPKNNDAFADRVIELMKNTKLRTDIGKKSKEKVRNKFLITRLILDYLDIMNNELCY